MTSNFSLVVGASAANRLEVTQDPVLRSAMSAAICSFICLFTSYPDEATNCTDQYDSHPANLPRLRAVFRVEELAMAQAQSCALWNAAPQYPLPLPASLRGPPL